MPGIQRSQAIPPERKRRLGNPGHAHLPDPSLEPIPSAIAAVGDVPAPPRPLEEVGRDAWDRLWKAAGYWLGAGDVELCTILCESIDERAGLRPILEAHPMNRDLREALRRLDHQITTALGVLGLTPTDRIRLNLGEVRLQTDLERFREQVARRRVNEALEVEA